MRERVMDINVHWERIKNEQLAFLLETKDEKGGFDR